jgi:septum formation protein
MIYLASSSPRRAELLHQIGVEFKVLAVDVDESPLTSETPEQYVRRVAKAKADTAGHAVDSEGIPILAADTTISIDNEIVGKPDDQAHCQCILSKLSGRTHQVLTCLAFRYQGKTHLTLSVNHVRFRVIETVEMATYCSSKEPLDKAGAYAIQGKAAIFVEKLEGSYSSVMGLPLFETAKILQQAGITPALR